MVIQNRKQIRLKKYDYSDVGWYFITACTQNRKNLFGNIISGKMILNEFGEIVKKYWFKIPKHFNNVELDEFQIMPNHVHGIIIIKNNIVGARSSRPILYQPTLSQIIGYFKYKTTKFINILIMGSEDPIIKGSDDPTPTKFKQIFQRSFYDHIIRNDHDLNRIRQYIKNNPTNWNNDRNNIS